MPDPSDPPAAPPEANEYYHHIQTLVPYSKTTGAKLDVIANDPLPPLDKQGRRRCEGWRAIFKGKVKEEWCNFYGTLHGGAVAYIVDDTTSATVMYLHTDTFWGPPAPSGVSQSLDVQYLNPAKKGTNLTILCQVIKMSTTLAILRCDITDSETGVLYYQGRHVKSWKAGKAGESSTSASGIVPPVPVKSKL